MSGRKRARDDAERLREHGVRPSAQRLAVAGYVLHTEEHPSADEVWGRVRERERFPAISRATVYNTLNLFVEKGLLRSFVLTEGRLVFDPHTADHHHFVDEETGRVEDVPWDALDVAGVERLAAREGLEVKEYQVVLRGRRGASGSRSRPRARRGRGRGGKAGDAGTRTQENES